MRVYFSLVYVQYGWKREWEKYILQGVGSSVESRGIAEIVVEESTHTKKSRLKKAL